MTEVHVALAAKVDDWRAGGYRHDRYPAIAEILSYAIEGEEPASPYPASSTLRFPRAAQFGALDTYWYLRIVFADAPTRAKAHRTSATFIVGDGEPHDPVEP